jgi:hypothetical protein
VNDAPLSWGARRGRPSAEIMKIQR